VEDHASSNEAHACDDTLDDSADVNLRVLGDSEDDKG
jgi:hypothetical protein